MDSKSSPTSTPPTLDYRSPPRAQPSKPRNGCLRPVLALACFALAILTGSVGLAGAFHDGPLIALVIALTFTLLGGLLQRRHKSTSETPP